METALSIFISAIIIITLTSPYWILGLVIFFSVKHKKIRRAWIASILFLLLIIIPGVYFRVLPGSGIIWKYSDNKREFQYMKSLTGSGFQLGKILYKFDSSRDELLGDGYSISIYELDDSIVSRYLKPDSAFFTEYPITPDSRSSWSVEHWKKTPSQSEEKNIIDFALSTYNSRENKILTEKFDEIYKLLNEEGNIYSYFYFMHNTISVGNIDLFIISPQRRCIIFINKNT